MLEIVSKSDSCNFFVNTIWVTLDKKGEACRVFREPPNEPGVESYEITIKSKNGLPEKNIFKLIKLGISFSDINLSSEFMLHDKSRLNRIKYDLTAYIKRTIKQETKDNYD